MNKSDARSLYDQLDQLFTKIDSYSAFASRHLSTPHFNQIKDRFYAIKQEGERLMRTMAETIIPEVEQHPDTEKRNGGTYIDGVRQ